MSRDLFGDQDCAALMQEAGFTGTPDEFRSLLAGIAAAPEQPGADPHWATLVGGAQAPDVVAELEGRVATLRQDFEAADGDRADRLTALRQSLASLELTGFVVPRSGQHPGEYLPAQDERLAWLTGFTGSAGTAVVLAETASLFVDGRYTVQAPQQIDGRLWTLCSLTEQPLEAWLARIVPTGAKVGYDPWLHTAAWVDKMRKALERTGGQLLPVEPNPIDALWTDRPPAPIAPVVPHPDMFAGRSASDKRAVVAEAITRNDADAAVITAPESIAWLLNVRGGDVPFTPLPLSRLVLQADGTAQWFVDDRKLIPGLHAHLGNQVSVLPEAAFGDVLSALGDADKTVIAEPASTAAWTIDRLHRSGATLRHEADPSARFRSCKTDVELHGAHAAHLRDGVAVSRFLAWMSRQDDPTALSENAVASRLMEERARGDRYRGDSFGTISASGANAALPHYRADPDGDVRLQPGSFFLFDSGAQYLDGTTDITRTVAIGTPSAEMRERYTLVLKGHIALATAQFPVGTTGIQLDALARQFLWHAGLDYDHGTGHGVGSYLGVHEGSARISKQPGGAALEPGMILSIEPGYYKPGAYGIRIENLVAVRPLPALPGADRQMLAFETLTLAPIDLTPVEPMLLTPSEVAWIDAYHRQVREALAPSLSAEDRDWLNRATVPVETVGG